MQYNRVLAIGDMHGNFNRLLNLIHKVDFDPEQDFLILLGDYIDRGDENMRCLRWAMEMSEKKNVIALRGNHEQMMYYYYMLGGTEGSIWLPNGGSLTKRELDAWLKREPDALQRCLDFIRLRPMYHQMFIEGQEYIFVHAGLRNGIPLNKQTEEALLWSRGEFYRNYTGSAKVICGHTPTPYFNVERADQYYPLKLDNNITIIDTGSFLPQGRISCIDVISDTIWQSNN